MLTQILDRGGVAGNRGVRGVSPDTELMGGAGVQGRAGEPAAD